MQFELKKAGCTAIADTNGGELISFQDERGTEYIWQGDPAYWSGRNPILFPIVGDLKDGQASFGGRTHKMPRHGFARRSNFKFADRGKDFIVFELQESEETLKQYPFPFRLSVTHKLLEDGFQTVFEVENTGEQPLPFCIGAHTAFRCPLHDGEHFGDYVLVFDYAEDAESISQLPNGCLSHDIRVPALKHSNTIPLDHGTFDRVDTLTFDGLRSKGVRLIHQPSGHGVYVRFEDFPMVGFWTMPNVQAPYLCIEPWHGCAAYDNEDGDFERKPYCIILGPYEKNRLQYTVKRL